MDRFLAPCATRGNRVSLKMSLLHRSRSPATCRRLDGGSVCVSVFAHVFVTHLKNILQERRRFATRVLSSERCGTCSQVGTSASGPRSRRRLGGWGPTRSQASSLAAFVSWTLAEATRSWVRGGGPYCSQCSKPACWHLFPSPPKSQWVGQVGPDWLRHSAQSTLSHRRGPLSRGSVDLLARTSALCSRRRHGLFLPRPLAQQTALTCHYAWGQSVSPHTDMQDHQRPWGFLPASLILHLP